MMTCQLGKIGICPGELSLRRTLEEPKPEGPRYSGLGLTCQWMTAEAELSDSGKCGAFCAGRTYCAEHEKRSRK
jgi:hypothetical protein